MIPWQETDPLHMLHFWMRHDMTVVNLILISRDSKTKLIQSKDPEIDNYTLLRICSTPTFLNFNLSGFEREPLKQHKKMIPFPK